MGFSTRLPSRMEPNALARIRAQRESAGQEVVDLTLSNPTRCGFHYPAEEIRAALSRPGILDYDPDPRGCRRAREAVAAWHGRGLSAEDLVLAASTSEAYGWIFKLLCDPGDEVLIPSPSYPLFEWLARLEGIRAKPVPSFHFDRWHLDPGGLEEACGSRTRAVVIVNPNNPTGHFLRRAEWRCLIELCACRNLALVVDEVFGDFALEAGEDLCRSALEDPDPPCPVFVLSGLSKIALLPQVKLGWVSARGPGRESMLKGLEFIADQYLSTSAGAQAGAADLLRLAPALQDQARTRLLGNLDSLDRALLRHPSWSRMSVEGGWSVVLRRPAFGNDLDFAESLLESLGILVHPGSFFGFPGEGHVVLSLLVPQAPFEEGVSRLLAFAPPL